jgi:Tol biopolymer transport system component
MDHWVPYVSIAYAATLEYPSNWLPISGYKDSENGAPKFAGDNGFFHVNAIGGETLDAVATSEATHHLRPYGANPIIENQSIQGEDARLILPSADQNPAMESQAALIVTYPQPVTIAGHTYPYFVLWADKAHIRALAQTLRFTDVPNTPATATPFPITTWENFPPGLVYNSFNELWLINQEEQSIKIHNDSRAMLSPDGNRLLTYDSNQDIQLVNLAEGSVWNLTRTSERVECCFQWWPAQPQRIVFLSTTDQSPSPSVALYLSAVQSDGTAYQILDPEHTIRPEYGGFALSPDGQTIAYGSDGTGFLYRDGRTEVFDPVADYGLVVRGGVEISNPAWSPDSKQLAWNVKGNLSPDGEARVGTAIFDLEKRSGRVLHPYTSQGLGWPPLPLWSPDGKWLVFSDSSASDNAGLWVVRMDGSWEEYRLGLGGNPIWSPDGQSFVFHGFAQDGSSHYLLAQAGTWETRVLDIPVDRYGTLVDWVNLFAR